MWKVTSPNGALVVNVLQGSIGELRYVVEKHDTPVTEECRLGIWTDIGDLPGAFAFRPSYGANS